VQDHDYDPDRIETQLQAMVATLAQPTQSPPVVLLPHCKECRWFGQCKQHESARNDIGQLGLKATVLDELRLKGIHTLAQFANLPEKEVRNVKGIKGSALRLQAQAMAFIEGRPMRFAPLHECIRQPAAMFDIETNPVNPSRTWSLGVGTHMDDVTVIVVAPRRPVGARTMPDGNRVVYVPNHDELWRTFAEYVAGVPKAFHWSGFDAQVMRRTAPPDVVPRLNPLMDDLLAHTKRTTAFPLNSLSLKVLGPYCGYQWSAYDTWDAAWLDYNKWLREDDDDALMRACAYQRDDVKAMFVVRDVLLSWD
jgi:predicted RecB family nuclease